MIEDLSFFALLAPTLIYGFILVLHALLPARRITGYVVDPKTEPALFMNCLLRTPIAAKTLGVLPSRARRAVKHACARSSPRHPVFSLLSVPSLRQFMNNAS